MTLLKLLTFFSLRSYLWAFLYQMSYVSTAKRKDLFMKRTFYSELAYVFGIIFLALGTALMES